ncbi:MAG: type II secretion system minor pseudopilin GspK, partial [Pseudomonas sp.]
MAALNMALSTYPASAIRQGGSAIISTLLTVAIVAVIAAGMLTRQSVMIRTVEAEQSRIQNSAALMAGLDASRMLLWDSRRK